MGADEDPSEKVWWLARKDLIPDDYKSVTIKSHRVNDPDGVRRFISTGTAPAAKVWMVDVERGGVVIKCDLIFPHHPPLDVVIFHLEEEDFKRLLGRERGPQEDRLADKGVPTQKKQGILGTQFRG